jgi:flagellar biosynthetic protein FlhB
MAEEGDSQDKTEEPSGKRLKDAHDKGQVARSRDLNAIVVLLFASVGFLIFGKELSSHLVVMMRKSFEFDAQTFVSSSAVFERLYYLMLYGVKALIPILATIFLLSLLAPLIMGGWVFSREQFSPKFSRLNLIKGLARMVSVKGLFEMIKAFLKFVLVAFVAFLVLKSQFPLLLALGERSLEVAIDDGVYITVKSFALISSSLLVIAVIDIPYQLYEHNKSLKMTKQELRDEYRESEGKPEVKSAIRRAQMEMSKRRMMAEVPKADVVLTNPTHYAVAISYKKTSSAPIVVAKGKDLIAFQINDAARKHSVPIISVPPLARAIYFSTKLNKEIPRGLYIAVAQVLAYIFQLRNKNEYDYKPELLQNVPIPPELAREAKEETE